MLAVQRPNTKYPMNSRPLGASQPSPLHSYTFLPCSYDAEHGAGAPLPRLRLIIPNGAVHDT